MHGSDYVITASMEGVVSTVWAVGPVLGKTQKATTISPPGDTVGDEIINCKITPEHRLYHSLYHLLYHLLYHT